jgi:hypothetical protein
MPQNRRMPLVSILQTVLCRRPGSLDLVAVSGWRMPLYPLEDVGEMALVRESTGKRYLDQRQVRFKKESGRPRHSETPEMLARAALEEAPEVPGQVRRMHTNRPRNVRDGQGFRAFLRQQFLSLGKPCGHGSGSPNLLPVTRVGD